MTIDVGNPPRVSIGLAVYNGEKYLEEAIGSILAQTFTDFELIISDNASTDRTADICTKYAAQDSRIRYVRNATNIGGANNENRTFQLARGEYFRWAAHDDICAPELLEQCVKVLDDHPDVVLCQTAVVIIDEHGNSHGTEQNYVGTASTPAQRFRQLYSMHHRCESTYGLMRSNIMRRTRLQLNYTDSDRVLLCELALYGPFYQIPEPLFYKRVHPGNQYKDWQGRMAWFLPDLQLSGRPTFPVWQQFFDYFVTIHRVPLVRRDKALCYLSMAPWLYVNGRRLVKEVFVAGYLLVQPRKKRKSKYANVDRWA